ncbi:MAG: GlxA family transcriptional regulator [Pseudomonadota bacterium]
MLSNLQSITILCASDTSLMTFASVLDPLRAANRLARQPVLQWQIIGFEDEPVILSSGIEISVDGHLTGEEQGDVLIVVAGLDQSRWMQTKYMVKLRQCARRFSSVFGVESGTWLLAKSGVILEHRVTTHWEDLEALANAYPLLNVRRDRYTIDRNIWTSGGASPALDMMLHYLRSSFNRSLAIDVASVFIYDDSHPSTDVQPATSLGQLRYQEPRVSEAITIMQANIEEPLSIAEINRAIGVSSKTMEKLFAKYVGGTPKAYYMRLRLQTARKLIASSSTPLTQIAVRCGFSSQPNFTRAFKRHFGVAPRSLRSSLT